MRDFLDKGYVISKNASVPTHLGDSLLWTMIAAATIPCSDAEVLFNSVSQSVHANDGLVLRFDPLPEKLESNQTSRDMEVGFAFGMTFLYKNCPEMRSAIQATWSRHINFIFNENNSLAKEGPRTKVEITPTLRYLLLQVTQYLLGQSSGASVMDQFLLDSATNVAAIGRSIGRKEPCYPAHLTTLSFMILDAVGASVGESNKIIFCRSTQGQSLPLTDWYCQRPGAEGYLDGFQLNQYEYRHQRCSYEEPDGLGTFESPAIDFLIAYAALNGQLLETE
jgi:hypothetical protein